MKIASQFVCHMYGQRKISDVNEARYNKLMQLTGKVELDKPLANIKRVDCALLPPCLRTLEMKVLRTRYVTTLWTYARTASPCSEMSPEDYGWCMNDNILEPVWFKGPAIPDNLFVPKNTEINIEPEPDNTNRWVAAPLGVVAPPQNKMPQHFLDVL